MHHCCNPKRTCDTELQDPDAYKTLKQDFLRKNKNKT